MDDLIRRSDAVKAIASQLAFNAEMKTAEKFSWVEFVGAAGWILEKCETVDAVPVRHGKWVIESDPSIGWERVTCSECGENVTSIGYAFDYCPNCGAKMEEDDETY